MKKVCGDEDMFALGSSVARVVQMASSDDEGTHALAYYVLSDVALTQRILRLANTVKYRTASGTAVTTISRAISLLGFDNVKTTALAMLLVDALASSEHAYSVRLELEASLCASLVGREMARHSFYQGAEEASIGALFKNLGPLLVASHEHGRYREVKALADSGKYKLAQAAQMILGCSYDALSEAVLGEWKIPDVIMRAQRPLAEGALKVAVNRGEWMRQVASFSLDVARLLAKNGEPAGTKEAQALLARYGHALNIDGRQLDELFVAVAQEMTSLLESMNLEPMSRQEEHEGDGLPNVLLLATLGAGEEEQGSYPSGKPKNARDLLLAGVQDVTQMRASGQGKVHGDGLPLRHRGPEGRPERPVPRPCVLRRRQIRHPGGLRLPRRAGGRGGQSRFILPGDGQQCRPDDLGRHQPQDPRPAPKLAPPAAAGREELHRAAAGGGPGPARPVLCRPHPGRAGRRAAGRDLADQGAQGPGTGCACALTKSPNSRAGIGRPNRKPWASSLCLSRRKPRWNCVSTPSATTDNPSECASPIVAPTIAASFGSCSMSLTKPRSILMWSIANSFK
jgi:HD-like signal output (HDOD) protein